MSSINRVLRNLANEQQKQLHQQAAASAAAVAAAAGVGGMAGVYDKLGLFNPAGLGVGVGAGWGNMSAWYNMANSFAAAGVPPVVPGMGVGGLMGAYGSGCSISASGQQGIAQPTSLTTPLSLITQHVSPSGFKSVQTSGGGTFDGTNPLSGGSKLSSDDEDHSGE